jgi:hypothetical protein
MAKLLSRTYCCWTVPASPRSSSAQVCLTHFPETPVNRPILAVVGIRGLSNQSTSARIPPATHDKPVDVERIRDGPGVVTTVG